MNRLNRVAFLFLCFFVSACSFGALDRGERHMLTLPAMHTSTPVQTTKSQKLVVGFPQADERLDTTRIALIKPDGTWDYYAQRRWTDFLPVIVQGSLSEALQNAAIYQTVQTDARGLGGDLILKPTIRRFEAAYPAYLEKAPEIILEIDFLLARAGTEDIIEEFTLRSAYQAHANQTAAIHDAFSNAFLDIQLQLTQILQK